MGLVSSEKIQKSFLFQLDQKAKRERTKAFLATHAAADDRLSQDVIYAEHLVRDAIEALDRHPDDKEFTELGERYLAEAINRLEHALAAWEPQEPKYDLFYFHPRGSSDEKRRN
jgi:hypothetical protein